MKLINSKNTRLLATCTWLVTVVLFSAKCWANEEKSSLSQQESSQQESSQSKRLVVYFSQPEDVPLDDVDGFSGASVLMKNEQKLGSTQYIAQLIAQKIEADIYRIEASQAYPLVHKPLIDLAAQEKRENARPSIQSPPLDFSSYDTVFVGYPIWWYQMPMILYTFFEQNDFAGKRVIPFTSHGGSRLSGTVQDIQALLPNSEVESNALSISRNDVADDSTIDEVYQWLESIRFE